MELRQIQHFIQLYKDQNITKASQNLFISQQGLSKSINKLEEELGLTLFERTVSGVIPTESADILHNSFINVERAHDKLKSQAASITRKRPINIIAPYGFAMSCPAEDFGEYSKLYPQNETRYREDYNSKLPDILKDGNADLAFVLGSVPDDFIIHQQTSKEPLYIVMNTSHPLAEKDIIETKDLENQNFLLLQGYEKYNTQILRELREMEIPYTIFDSALFNEFLPMLSSGSNIGFACKSTFQYYHFPYIHYVPLQDKFGKPIYVESFLISWQNTYINDEMQHYIDYEQKKQNGSL